jgi:hypothetical protein
MVISEELANILLVSVCVVAVLTLLLTVVLFVRLNHFRNAHRALKAELTGGSLEALLGQCLTQVTTAENTLQTITDRVTRLEGKARLDATNISLVRFNSNEKMGAELSFALALLNQEGTGIIITCVQSVEDCRVYARSIVAGEAKMRLLPEEQKAVDQARRSSYTI